ncbi:MAG: hypothetical protein QOC91_95 [Solirubrobacteraceae bacterium]|nr:hypothetical protein [Solirubrobacteraceae bacterium]
MPRLAYFDAADGPEAIAEQLERTRQAVELLLVLGNYMAIARLIASSGLQPEEPIVAGSSPNGLAE